MILPIYFHSLILPETVPLFPVTLTRLPIPIILCCVRARFIEMLLPSLPLRLYLGFHTFCVTDLCCMHYRTRDSERTVDFPLLRYLVFVVQYIVHTMCTS